MKKNDKSQDHEKQVRPQTIIVAEMTEVREMIAEVIKEHIDPPRHSILADKPVLNTVEAAEFLTEQCGHKTSVPTIYAQITQFDKSVERGCFKRISRPIPHSRVGKYLYFKPEELKQWAEEQFEYSKNIVPQSIKLSNKINK